MMKTILLCDAGKCRKIMQIEMDADNGGLQEALRRAALEYCRMEEGHRLFLERGGLEYEDFVNYVPEAIRKKHGILEMTVITPDLVVDGEEQLLSSNDAIHLAEHFHSLSDANGDTCKVAVRLAEMWGIMETLDGQDVLAECGTEQNISRLIAWAEEYVSEGNNDLPAFFKEKLRRLRE